jgi:hypothetical protein
MLSINVTGTFNETDRFLSRFGRGQMYNVLDAYARRGVAALAAATPVATGVTANSWDYEIEISGGDAKLWWTNRDKDEAGTPIIILLQFGHGTGTGGYVQGRDFINPAIQPIFDEIAAAVWKEVSS